MTMILTDDNYFSLEAENEFLGSTQVKRWQECEKATESYLKGEYQYKMSDSMLVGHFIHSYVENNFDYDHTLKEYSRKFPEIVSSRGKTSGELKSTYKVVEEIAKTIENDPVLKKILSGGKEEILTGTIAGHKFKIKVDIIKHDKKVFIDLKTMKSIYEKFWVDGEWGTFIDKYSYTQQMAIYQEIIRQNTGETYKSMIAVLSKEEVIDKEIIYFPDDLLKEELEKVIATVEEVLKIKAGVQESKACGKCNYCKSIKKIKKQINVIDFKNKVLGVE